MKLGEALVKDGLITRQQLDQVLRRQAACWGRIGTNIVELHFLKEEELSKFLSKFFKLPAVSPEMLKSIPEDVINSLTREIAQKFMILPFKKERNRLYAAMLNPRDIKQIDEVSFRTGLHVIPYVITELRLQNALSRYYGIKSAVRYALTDRVDTDIEVKKTSVDQIKAAFADILDSEEIADLLVKESYRSAKRVALFSVKDGKIRAWKTGGLKAGNFEIYADDSPIFSEVLRKGSVYRGPILNQKGNEPLIEVLSASPHDALILPIRVRGKTFAMLYADYGNESFPDTNAAFLSMLAAISAIAFEIRILRNKILDFSFSTVSGSE